MALIDIRNILRRYGLETSEDFQIYIAKMSRMLRLWRHGDGKLALFHNSQDNGKPLIDSVLGQVESCLLYTSPSPRDGLLSRMPSSA